MKNINFFILVMAFTVFSSCKEKDQKQETTPEQMEQESSKDYIAADLQNGEINTNLITENGFMGFEIGDKIDPKSKYLKKSVQRNGEGSFDGYAILDNDGDEIGFIFPKYENKEDIGMIEISSPKFKTKNGIGVSSTYQDLMKTYPTIETHGSEIESRTNSTIGNMSFQLDVPFATYTIDESKIKPSTTILKISISQH
ncbi:hypothetical protein QO200_05390 [Flavobacterium sp. Arc3]|jgi:hypothetical protein|uniref:hypothetical protein n=1 Tax=Flavobacterium sp. Arc3 TaxID=3046686 RepID=UPI00352DBE1C